MHLSPSWLIPLTFIVVAVYIQYVVLGNLPVIYQPMYSLTGMSVSSFLVVSSFVGPLGGMFGPLAGTIKQFLGNGTSFFTLSLVGVSVCILLLIPILEVQFLTVLMIGVFRVAMNAVGYAYIADDQPEEYYGTLITDLMSVTICAALATYPTNYVSYQLLEGDMIPVTIFLLTLGILGFGVAIYFWVRQAAGRKDDSKGSSPADQEEPEVNGDTESSEADGAASSCREARETARGEQAEEEVQCTTHSDGVPCEVEQMSAHLEVTASEENLPA